MPQGLNDTYGHQHTDESSAFAVTPRTQPEVLADIVRLEAARDEARHVGRLGRELRPRRIQ
jgi:hypothetical protein